MTTCRHCQRGIVKEDGRWIDPEATGDDSVWRETCGDHDTFMAEHEPAAGNRDVNGDPRWHAMDLDATNIEDLRRNPYLFAVVDSEVGILAYAANLGTADALADALFWATEAVKAKRDGGDTLAACIDVLDEALYRIDRANEVGE